ncbi:MAG: hypothetical protein ACTSWD_11710 [Candidatus Heimdallarchaeota archaeon]
MGKLNKTEMEHIRQRIDSIVKCTNGEIATRLNRIKKGTGLTVPRMYEIIKAGKATILSEHEILKTEKYSYTNMFEGVCKCFSYPETVTQKDKKEFNWRIEQKKEELMQEVTLEGKRLIDRIVLGLVELKYVPEELHKLGSMSSLARAFKSSDFT